MLRKLTGGLLLANVLGCVSGGVEVQTASEPVGSSPAGEQVAEEQVDDPADAVFDWQKTLIESLDDVEARGQGFLDASFDLYDRLLNDDKFAADAAQVDAKVAECSTLYQDLTLALGRLEGHLTNKEIASSLPVASDEGARELGSLLETLGFFRQAVQAVKPDSGSLGARLFGNNGNTIATGLDSLPKAQRDALLLLDRLREVSNDLAYISATVTAWIHVQPEETETVFVH